MRKVSAVVAGLLVVACGSPALRADLAYFEGTGHYYELVQEYGLTWDEARAGAQSRGSSADLATITSAEENAFIADNVLVEVETHGYWLGGYQPPDSDEPDVDWQWVTGEPWSYTNWNAGGTTEPNDLHDGEEYPFEDWLEIYAESRYWGKWNDLHKNRPFVAGYIVEYATAPPGAPAPGAAFLGLIGLGMVACFRKRRAV